MSDNEQKNETHETVADILAEYRNDVDAMDRGWLYKPTTEYVRRLLDRIEAAWKREARAIATENAVLPAVCITKSSGNAAVMREAIVAFVRAYEMDNELDNIEATSEAYEKARAALSSPPRNCDVGTAEEQTHRMLLYCKTHGVDESGCFRCEKCLFLTDERCELSWAQMSYDAEQEGSRS